MSIPLLSYAPSSRNHRVSNFEVPGDEQPRVFATQSDLAKSLLSQSEMGTLIRAAYRQIFNEQQMLASHRQNNLESQLRSGQISVRQFIHGLATSDSFRRLNYEANNNYRFVQMCVQRILGRDVYSDRERLAWSIVLATQGLNGFIDALINSDEYSENFGDNVVPYQRRRILPQRSKGEVTFAHTARYGSEHLKGLKTLGNDFSAGRDVADYSWRPPLGARQAGAIFTYTMAGLLGLGAVAVILSWFGFISL